MILSRVPARTIPTWPHKLLLLLLLAGTLRPYGSEPDPLRDWNGPFFELQANDKLRQSAFLMGWKHRFIPWKEMAGAIFLHGGVEDLAGAYGIEGSTLIDWPARLSPTAGFGLRVGFLTEPMPFLHNALDDNLDGSVDEYFEEEIRQTGPWITMFPHLGLRWLVTPQTQVSLKGLYHWMPSLKQGFWLVGLGISVDSY